MRDSIGTRAGIMPCVRNGCSHAHRTRRVAIRIRIRIRAVLGRVACVEAVLACCVSRAESRIERGE